MIVDFRKQQREHPLSTSTVVEKVESFKFLSVHITDKNGLKWSTHTDSVVKKTQQHNIQETEEIWLVTKNTHKLLQMHNREHPVGYGNCSAHNLKALQRLVRSAQRITGGKLPAFQDSYTTRCHRQAKNIIKDNNHTRHCLFTPLSSRRRGQYRCIKAGTERLENSFYLKAIRLLNSHH
jgi:hypothetical protein